MYIIRTTVITESWIISFLQNQQKNDKKLPQVEHKGSASGLQWLISILSDFYFGINCHVTVYSVSKCLNVCCSKYFGWHNESREPQVRISECWLEIVILSKHISIQLRADQYRLCLIWPCLLSQNSVSATTYTFLIAIATVAFSSSSLSEHHGREDVE